MDLEFKFFIKFSVKVVDNNRSEENSKLAESNLNNNVERIKIDFSDIYASGTILYQIFMTD